ncbi:MAG: hypothetical protein LC733_11480 [Actinobacteria bacterium]|nr:hypothetical protein [Actinomycetota bacterium]
MTTDMVPTKIVRVALLAGLILTLPAMGSPALAQDNSAVAVNTEDGSSLFKFAFSINRVAGDVVDPQNAAVAYASCEGCTTVAVAIQVVLVSGDPSVVAPENVAIAINDDCDLCVTMAMAFQFVFSTGDEPFHLTKEGKARLHEIKKQFKELKHADITPGEMQARVNTLAQAVIDVLVDEFTAAPEDEDPEPSEGATTSTTAATASTTVPDVTTSTTVAAAPSTSTTLEPSTTTSTVP